MTNSKYADPFDRAKDERELTDVIWLLAGSEAYRVHRMHEIVRRPRLEVVAWYYAENPEIKRWVDRNIEAGTCAAAVVELRSKIEEMRRWRHEQLGDVPTSERNPESAWTDEFRMRPREIPDLFAPAKNAGKPRPTNSAVRQWMRDRVASWPDDTPSPSERDDLNAAMQHFADGLSRDDFRIVRKSESPMEWHKQGPRRPWGEVKN